MPRGGKELCSLLNAVRGLYMREPPVGNRGRPPRYAREQLLRVDARLRELLGRETRLSVRSFVGQYLPIIDFPKDVPRTIQSTFLNIDNSYNKNYLALF